MGQCVENRIEGNSIWFGYRRLVSYSLSNYKKAGVCLCVCVCVSLPVESICLFKPFRIARTDGQTRALFLQQMDDDKNTENNNENTNNNNKHKKQQSMKQQ